MIAHHPKREAPVDAVRAKGGAVCAAGNDGLTRRPILPPSEGERYRLTEFRISAVKSSLEHHPVVCGTKQSDDTCDVFLELWMAFIRVKPLMMFVCAAPRIRDGILNPQFLCQTWC